ncbi:mechanosensitive ion channel domain-containing protein [Teichococcus aestuarii]|uniref:mechanosensitive ion channel domain-containing protein n=1 Tax=Teichococcus aestuarii TaxID=568898 RepID=UPI003621FE58
MNPRPAAATGLPGGLWPLALLAAGSAGLWLLSWLAEDHLLLGHGPVQAGLRIGATLGTALLVVMAGGRAVLGLGLSAGLGLEPTGLQRAIAYSVLTFAASAVVLASFGFDITAVLTTSAILTAAVGLALQPTLGSLISGVALHMDRVLHVGDTIVLDGRKVEIVRLDWRTAIGRRRDGTTIVIPNARICNDTMVVYPAGQPVRQDSSSPPPPTCRRSASRSW